MFEKLKGQGNDCITHSHEVTCRKRKKEVLLNPHLIVAREKAVEY